MINKIRAKIYRLKTSINYLKFIKIFHILFGENFKKIIEPEFFDKKIHRIDIVKKIIEIKGFNSYLEIGCDQNELFKTVNINKKIGVDPVSGGTHRMTSDKFFEKNKDKFDLIFIDGLHTYKQVRKDILNSLDSLNDKGFLLIHDCFPLSYFDQAVPRAQRKWNGDVWRAITELRTYDEINVCVGSFDNGIGLIFKSKNKNKLFIDNDFKKIKFKDYYENYKNYLNLLNYTDFFKEINDHK